MLHSVCPAPTTAASRKTVQQKTKLELTILEKQKADLEGGRVQKELFGRLRHAVELIDLGARLASKKSKRPKASADKRVVHRRRCGSSNRQRWSNQSLDLFNWARNCSSAPSSQVCIARRFATRRQAALRTT